MKCEYGKYSINTVHDHWRDPTKKSCDSLLKLVDVKSFKTSETLVGYTDFNVSEGVFNFNNCTKTSYTPCGGTYENNTGLYTSYNNNDYYYPYVVYKQITGIEASGSLCINTYHLQAKRYVQKRKGTYCGSVIAEKGEYPTNGIKEDWWWVELKEIIPKIFIKTKNNIIKIKKNYVKIDNKIKSISNIKIKLNNKILEVK